MSCAPLAFFNTFACPAIFLRSKTNKIHAGFRFKCCTDLKTSQIQKVIYKKNVTTTSRIPVTTSDALVDMHQYPLNSRLWAARDLQHVNVEME